MKPWNILILNKKQCCVSVGCVWTFHLHKHTRIHTHTHTHTYMQGFQRSTAFTHQQFQNHSMLIKPLPQPLHSFDFLTWLWLGDVRLKPETTLTSAAFIKVYLVSFSIKSEGCLVLAKGLNLLSHTHTGRNLIHRMPVISWIAEWSGFIWKILAMDILWLGELVISTYLTKALCIWRVFHMSECV